MKTKNNILILQRIINKSDQIMNDIVNLTMQISTRSDLSGNKEESSLVSPYSVESNKNEIADFRNILIEQFKESTKIIC